MKKPSLRKSIDEYCKWCIHDPLSGLGHWRQQVEGCTATQCPLFNVRPRSRLKGVIKTDMEQVA